MKIPLSKTRKRRKRRKRQAERWSRKWEPQYTIATVRVEDNYQELDTANGDVITLLTFLKGLNTSDHYYAKVIDTPSIKWLYIAVPDLTLEHRLMIEDLGLAELVVPPVEFRMSETMIAKTLDYEKYDYGRSIQQLSEEKGWQADPH